MRDVKKLCMVAAAVAGLAFGCGDDEEGTGTVSAPISGDAGSDAGVPPGPCEGAADGDECGPSRHCVAGTCREAYCGDGVVDDGEACDDGNEVAGDGCTPSCGLELPTCGDGNVDSGEECDDGNRFDSDGCTNECRERLCGNARVEDDEECDDGNGIDDDECSNHCTENKCRNGRLDPGEECDDGNRVNGDGCTNLCVEVICGNGEVEAPEECDDGNQVDDDACANACTANVCGNARVDPGEVCDGDTVEGPCSDDCQAIGQDLCRPCEDENCRDYLGLGIDLVAGCFEAPDPEFAQLCIDLLSCARSNRCGYTGYVMQDCYCGTASAEDCENGVGVNGPCKELIETAATTTDSQTVLVVLSNRNFPLGAAQTLLSCDVASCAEQCVPAL